jgi:hypothetical protein
MMVLMRLIWLQRPRIRRGEATAILALSIGIPGLLAVTQMATNQLTTSGLGVKSEIVNHMNYGSIFGLRNADWHILDAPRYDDPPQLTPNLFLQQSTSAKDPYELLIDNKHSYLALLHLAIFTDILNIFQYDPTDFYFGQRSARNQRLMAVSVKTSIPFTAASIICVGILSLTMLPSRVRPRNKTYFNVQAALILGLAWFANIVVFFPFIPTIYGSGYWTPRLILPALIIFLLLTFYCLDRLTRPFLRFRVIVLSACILQSLLHISFLWPWGSM